MICGFCVTLFLFVWFVCSPKIFVPSVSSLQSLTLGTRVLPCGLFEHSLVEGQVYGVVAFLKHCWEEVGWAAVYFGCSLFLNIYCLIACYICVPWYPVYLEVFYSMSISGLL